MKKWMLVTSALLMSAAAFAGSAKMMKELESELFLNPFLESSTVDKALFVNTPMPATVQIISKDIAQEAGFNAGFREMAGMMKEGERLVIAVPASYGVVFSDGTCPEETVYQHIQEVLSATSINPGPSEIMSQLAQLDDVMRATFVVQDGKLQLVTDEKGLHIGQPIWCKIPDGVIASVYHSEQECLMTFQRAGLVCEEIRRPCFNNRVQYDMWRTAKHECGKTLGEGYIENHPFTIYYVVKRA